MYCYNCGKEIAETVKSAPIAEQNRSSPSSPLSVAAASAARPAATRPMAEPPAAGHSMAGSSAAHPAAEPSGGE